MTYEFKRDSEEVTSNDLFQAKKALESLIASKQGVSKDEATLRLRYFLYSCLKEFFLSTTKNPEEMTHVN